MVDSMGSSSLDNQYFVFADGHYVGRGFVGQEQAGRLRQLRGLRLVPADLAPLSFPNVPALPGCIHSVCPKCGTEVHNLERFAGDPVGALWYRIECDSCAGPVWRTGVYLDADGQPVGARC